jgi:hypothetical protein
MDKGAKLGWLIDPDARTCISIGPVSLLNG